MRSCADDRHQSIPRERGDASTQFYLRLRTDHIERGTSSRVYVQIGLFYFHVVALLLDDGDGIFLANFYF